MNTLPSMSTHHLLMIEDDTRLAQMVGDYLGNNGLQVTHMGDARSGLEQLQPADGVPGADLRQRIATLTARLGNVQTSDTVQPVASAEPASGKDKLISMLEALAERVEARAHS